MRDIEGKAARVAATERGSEGVSKKQECFFCTAGTATAKCFSASDRNPDIDLLLHPYC